MKRTITVWVKEVTVNSNGTQVTVAQGSAYSDPLFTFTALRGPVEFGQRLWLTIQDDKEYYDS